MIHPASPDFSEFDPLCEAFERAWQAGQTPQIEEGLSSVAPAQRSDALVELLRLEVRYRCLKGETPQRADYVSRFPNQPEALDAVFGAEEHHETPQPSQAEMESTLHYPGDRVPEREPSPLPAQIGRYRVVKLLGEGGFGRVYEGYDDTLKRAVAIKVPRADRLARPEDLQAYLREAQTAAGLDHPHIVPVYDVGHTDEFPLFVVSKRITGNPLSERLAKGPVPPVGSAAWVAQIAEALEYAHRQGLVHRDVKPANILLDAEDRPLLMDFGLALHEAEQPQRRNEMSGSPAYMAPEQVAGKSHHLDGRTDIWALGVILYELLTGRRPFQETSRTVLFEEIHEREPKPPRMIDPRVPEPLERIVLQCLAKTVGDRYATAGDLARDLNVWLAETTESVDNPPVSSESPSPPTWRWPLLVGLALAVLGLGVAGVIWSQSFDDSQGASSPELPPDKPPKPSPAPPKPVVPLQGDLNVLVYRDEEFLPIEAPRARPVQNGDLVRVEAQLNRPAYVYLAWIDSAGQAQPFYPGDPEDWSAWQSPPKPVSFVAFPPGGDSGLPIIGEAGMETIVMLAADEPLPDDLSPQNLFANLPSQPLRQSTTLLYLDNAQKSKRRLRGGDWQNIQTVGDPALETQRKLHDRFADHVSLIHAVIFAHNEDQ